MDNKNMIVGTTVFVFSLAGMWISGFLVGNGIGARRQLKKDTDAMNEVTGMLNDLITDLNKVVDKETEE